MGFLYQPNVTVNKTAASYNSTLWIRNVSDTVNADLTLKLHVRFVKIDQPDNLRGLVRSSDMPMPEIVPWGLDWDRWKQQVLQLVTEYWHNRLYLTPRNFCGLDWRGSSGNVLRPNFRCGLTVSESGNPHLKIGCVRIPPGGFHTSFFMPRQRILWLDCKDTITRTETGGGGQVPVVHEFGHVLGLNHVNARSEACRNATNGNSRICYGANPSRQRGDVMGGGMRLDGWHAWPWKNRIKEHLERLYRDVEMNGATVRPAPRRLQAHEIYEPSPNTAQGGVQAVPTLDGGV